jgi:hypothetical protein
LSEKGSRVRWLGAIGPLVALLALLMTDAWPVVPAVVALIAAVHGRQWLGRHRVRAAQAAGQGRWEGHLNAVTAAAWLWDVGGVALFCYQGWFPCRFTGDGLGLTVAPRGLLLPRLRRYRPVTIPWTDIAGGRQLAPVRRNWDGQFSVLPLTELTIDVVGATARGLDDLNGDPDAMDAADAQETLDDLRDLYGPQWQPGTVALTAWLSSPDGLLDLVTARAQGRPSRAVRRISGAPPAGP